MTTQSPSQARWAVFTIFLLNGLIIGAWVPHVPLAKERLGVGPGVFGLALLAIAIGAVIAMPVTGALINRFGSARMTLVWGTLFSVFFMGPAMAPTLPIFIFSALAMGAAMGSTDVSMNAHGIAVEKALKLPIMSGLHGAFSVGAMLGAFLGAALVQYVGAKAQVFIVCAIYLVIHLAACRFLLPSSLDKGLSGSSFALPTKATIGLGLLCFLALMVEGSVLDWAAIMMREKFVLDAGIAALAFGFYQGGMAATRLTGDFLRQKFGAVNLVTASAVMAATGTTLALVAPNAWLTFAGFLCGGLGIGNLAPVLFAGGGRLEPEAPGRGIAAVTTLGYSGFLCGPPLIGFVAQLSSLPVALGLTVLASIIIAIFARAVSAADTY
ncbi:MAG: MFS transporter [Alphaproteobacteria bacterium]|nr:MFS transporter [Alphaproteobacteria bacterium]